MSRCTYTGFLSLSEDIYMSKTRKAQNRLRWSWEKKTWKSRHFTYTQCISRISRIPSYRSDTLSDTSIIAYIRESEFSGMTSHDGHRSTYCGMSSDSDWRLRDSWDIAICFIYPHSSEKYLRSRVWTFSRGRASLSRRLFECSYFSFSLGTDTQRILWSLWWGL